MGTLIDITGQKFGRLTVLSRAGSTPSREARWRCVCICGNETLVSSSNLRNGHVRSCGCYASEITSARSIIHGLSHSRIEYVWRGMCKRCYLTTGPAYPRYGGRGIKVCDEWKNDFMAFYKWSIEYGYTDELTLDRINNNGDYCPENCRWVDMKTQQNNKSNNHIITFNGKSQTLTQWAEECNMKPVTLVSRLRREWSVEEALNTPVGSKRCGRSRCG